MNDPKAQTEALRDEAVSPVIGVILMVAITVIIAAIVFVLSAQFGKTEHDNPQVTMVFDDLGAAPGGILTVSDIANGPIDIATIILGGTSHEAEGCQWSRATGSLAVGDQLRCGQPGTITVTESTRQVLLHSNSFH